MSFASVLPLGVEMPGLQPQIEALMAQYKSLQSGMFFLDLDTVNYLDINGDRVFPAASTIKLPILKLMTLHLFLRSISLTLMVFC